MSGSRTRDRWLLGIDAGLTSVKAGVVSPDGTQRAVASRRTPKTAPASGRSEVDVDELWSAVVDVVAETIASGPADPAQIAAVGAVGHGHGLYALDADGTPVRPGIRSTDSRGNEVISAWSDDGTRVRIRNRIGYDPFGADPISLLAWLRDNEPQAYDRIDSVLFCKDYLAYRLTGRVTTDEMESSVFTDPRTGEYATGLLQDLGLGRVADALPPITNSWERCGTVTRAAAAETGLTAGTPVATGLHDIGAVALGTGAHEPGDGVLILGTWGQSIVIDEGTATGDDTHASVDTGPGDSSRAAGIPRAYLNGKRLRYKGNRSAAASLDWFTDAFGDRWRRRAESEDVGEYEMYDRIVDGTAPGSNGLLFHPYLRGSTDDPKATGGFYGLDADHTPDHLLRAVYEGVAIAGVNQLHDLEPADRIETLRLSGGGARSEAWSRIVAGVAAEPVIVPAGDEAGINGAAICAAIAADIHPDHRTAVDRMVTVGRTHEPDPEAAAVYRQRRETFADLRSAIRPLWGELGSSGRN